MSVYVQTTSPYNYAILNNIEIFLPFQSIKNFVEIPLALISSGPV